MTAALLAQRLHRAWPLAGALLAVSPSPARAESCESPDALQFMPYLDQEHVPLNAAVFQLIFTYYSPLRSGPALVHDASGVVVETTSEIIDQVDWDVVITTPVASLEPYSSYTLNLSTVPDVPFRTGDELDTAAPGQDVILDAHAIGGGGGDSGTLIESGWMYDAPYYIWMQLDDTLDHEEQVVHEVQASLDEDFTAPLTAYGFGSYFPFGDIWCAPQNMELIWGETWYVRSRAMDIAGNTGPWSDPVVVETRYAEDDEPTDAAWGRSGCGCGTTKASGLAVGLLLLSWARRRIWAGEG